MLSGIACSKETCSSFKNSMKKRAIELVTNIVPVAQPGVLMMFRFQYAAYRIQKSKA